MVAREDKFVQGMLLPASFDVDQCKSEILKQSKKAIKAIIEHEKDANKNKLFPEEDSGILIRFGLKRLRLEGGFKRAVVQLRNPERLIENTSICLILPDFDYKKTDRHDPDVDKHARRWADILREKYGLTGKEITKIYTFIQLKRELLDVKDKNRFVSTYDVIMVQRDLLDPVAKFLGHACFNSKKFPFAINPNSSNFAEKIASANSIVNLAYESNEMHVQVRFGNTLQTKKQLLENLEDVLDKAADFLPGSLFNVQVVRMQTERGLALPVYVDFGTANEVVLEKPDPSLEPIIDECSTLPEGLKIKVTKRKIDVLTNDDEKVFYPTLDDEWERHDDLKPTMTREKLVKKLLNQRETKLRRADAPKTKKAKKSILSKFH